MIQISRLGVGVGAGVGVGVGVGLGLGLGLGLGMLCLRGHPLRPCREGVTPGQLQSSPRP